MTATRSPRTAIVLFTRDLRVHDHEGLTEAVAGFERVAPLFVLDDRILIEPPSCSRRSTTCAARCRDAGPTSSFGVAIRWRRR